MTIITLIACLFTLITIYNTVAGFGCYIAIRILVPYIARVPSIDISLNSVCLFILILILFFKKELTFSSITSRKEFKFILWCSLIIIINFTTGIIPINFQISEFIQFIYTEIIPMLIGLIIIKREKDLRRVDKILLITAYIACIYGFITLFIKSNPVFLYFAQVFGVDESIEGVSDLTLKARGGIEGSAASMAYGDGFIWSQISLILLGYIIIKKNELNKTSFFLIISFLVLNCFLTGYRSSFIALCFSFILFLYKKQNIKRFITTIFIVISSIAILLTFEAFSKYRTNINSIVFFWEENAGKNIKGSSVSLRRNQFSATLNSLEENPFGKGFGYPKYNTLKRGKDPVMFGYESIFFKASWENGFIGLIIWTLIFLKISRYIYIKKKENTYFLFWGYIISILLTGIQSSLFLFLILVSLSHKYLQHKEIKAINNTKNNYSYQ